MNLYSKLVSCSSFLKFHFKSPVKVGFWRSLSMLEEDIRFVLSVSYTKQRAYFFNAPR